MTPTTPDRDRTGERGAALFIAVYVSLLVFGLMMASSQISLGSHNAHRSSVERTRAHFLSDAGLSEALVSLRAGGDGDVGVEGNPGAYGGGTFWVEATDIGDGRTSLVSTADVGTERVVIQMITESGDAPLHLQYGVFGELGVFIDSGGLVDSYDSTAGKYVGWNKGADAHVASNDDITIKSGSAIDGDATAGPGDSVSTESGSKVSGTTSSATEEVELPAIEVPVIAASGAYFVSNKSKTLAAGDYHFSSFYLESGARLTVTGPARIVVDELFISGSRFFCDTTNGPVEVYCTGKVSIESGSRWGPVNQSPADLQFFITSTDDVLVASGSDSYGVFYAPDAKVVLESGSDIFGGVTAKEVEMKSGSNVHWDSSMGSGGAGGDDHQVVFWRVLSETEKKKFDAEYAEQAD